MLVEEVVSWEASTLPKAVFGRCPRAPHLRQVKTSGNSGGRMHLPPPRYRHDPLHKYNVLDLYGVPRLYDSLIYHHSHPQGRKEN